jgi:alkylation response protein AidB-like acyl-CoA dehydrogenase
VAEQFLSMRNLKFLLYEVLDAESLCDLPYFSEHDREIFDMALDTGLKLGTEDLFPAFAAMDKEHPAFVDGTVRVSPVVRKLFEDCGEGGWIGAGASFEHGGMQLPDTVLSAFRFILAAANYSACAFPLLGSGSAQLICSFGSQELIDTYVPPIFEGKWQGTMALTEPQAGSSLNDLETEATRTENGYFLLKGQKIFISCGEHDAADNVVHLMLSRIEGAPTGIKGISLFVVPKLRPTDGGALESNDVACTAIYHKLGYRGAPITQLELGEHGDCRGWLVGEENHGLRYMFQMMNEARVGVGMGATAIATAAYYAALDYTKERRQGRPLLAKDPATPQIPIIEHADVKRMLLFQRAIVEGSLALTTYCSKLIDLVNAGPDEEKERHAMLLDFLTPIAKTYPSEMGILSVSTGLQCLGGYGYCDEFTLEQYYRDVRIHTIHEGTTGIQGMDLLGRKVTMKNGAALMLFLEEVQKTIGDAQKYDTLKAECESLALALVRLGEVTQHLGGIGASGKVDLFLADATLYLEYVGIITIAWQWLMQAAVAESALANSSDDADKNFYLGKRTTCHYFCRYELPKCAALSTRLMQADGLTAEMDTALFED